MASITKAERVYGEPDRATVTANNIVVDIIASDDGTVSIETYPYAQAEPRLSVVIETQYAAPIGHVLTLKVQEA